MDSERSKSEKYGPDSCRLITNATKFGNYFEEFCFHSVAITI
ncbi:MAG: hypothetical protein RR561_03380 [Peptostreptococcus sp.]